MRRCIYGLVHALARQPRAAESDLPFAVARDNFYAAARHGLQAELTWLDGRRYSARNSILESRAAAGAPGAA